MSEEKAKYILSEIKSISRYSKIIDGINRDLKEIADEIRSIQEPSSPTGKTGPKIENHTDKMSIVLDKMTDEGQLLKEKDKFERRKREAENLRTLFFTVCPEEDKEFATDFFKGKQYRWLEVHYHYANVYKKMISIANKIPRV